MSVSGITTTNNNNNDYSFAESEAAREQEQASTNRIREETRRAVNEYRQNHPPRTSASSSGTLAGTGAEAETEITGEEPSDGRFAKAGLIGAASGSGAAAKAHIGTGEGIQVPDKHGLLSPQLKVERKKMLKVCHVLVPPQIYSILQIPYFRSHTSDTILQIQRGC